MKKPPHTGGFFIGSIIEQAESGGHFFCGLKSEPSGPGPTAVFIFFVGVTKKMKQKKTRTWRWALHSRLTLPLFIGDTSIDKFRRCGSLSWSGLRGFTVCGGFGRSNLPFAPWRSAEWGGWKPIKPRKCL